MISGETKQLSIRTGATGIVKNEEGLICIQLHKKLDCYTLPGGKCDEGEIALDAIFRELKEELGIDVLSCQKLFYHDFIGIEYPAHSGNMQDFRHTYFNIISYAGEVVNMEPEKHPELIWLTIEEIKNLDKKSWVLQEYLKYLENMENKPV